MIALDQLASNNGTIAAFEVTNYPFALGNEDLGMAPTASLVLDDDLIGRRPTNRNDLAGDQPEDVRPIRTFGITR